MIVAAADGSALGNPGPAGWAWVVSPTLWRAGGWSRATNNQAEIMAVIDLLESVDPAESVHVLCDSQYVVKSVTEWIPGWKRRGWRKADKSPVRNRELLQRLDALLADRQVTFEWVKGHAGHDLNEAADDYARAAATAYRDGRPCDSGPGYVGARPTSATRFDPQSPADFTHEGDSATLF